jgi:DNA-binding XRE family transcriptional regulator
MRTSVLLKGRKFNPSALQKYKDERHWSTSRLASAIDVMHVFTVSQWLQGKKTPTVIVAHRICHRLGISIDELFPLAPQ